MDRVKALSPSQCILLAVALASAADVASLHKFTPLRPDVFDLELVFRILLSYLPESLDPIIYTTYIEEVGTRVYLQQHDQSFAQLEEYAELSQENVRAGLKKVHLLPLRHPSTSNEATKDALDVFLIHRAHRIDVETGLFSLIPQLFAPFLERSEYLQDWYIRYFLPLHRLDYEYYPQEEPKLNIDALEALHGEQGVQMLLSRTKEAAAKGVATPHTIGRDFRGVLGPWIHGGNSNKRRKLGRASRSSENILEDLPKLHFEDRSTDIENRSIIENWQQSFRWIVNESVKNFPLVVQVLDGWDGPQDIDLGGILHEKQFYRRDNNLAEDLRYQYCQAAFASIFATELDAPETLDGAHTIMVRLAELCNFEPPPDLATSIKLLPKIQRYARGPEQASATSLQLEELLQPDQLLTAPKLETFSLLQMLVYSAYQFKGLGLTISVARVSKYRFWSDETEQIKLVDDILRGLVNHSSRTTEQWSYNRDVLLWLWNWGLDEEPEGPRDGYGVLGKMDFEDLETRIFKALCTAQQFPLIRKVYFEPIPDDRPLAAKQLERLGAELIFAHYDAASNGNRNRGEIKKAGEILDLFRSAMPESLVFRRLAALLTATHALSFYSLALHRGQPFRPLDIHNTEEPISLLGTVLEQNHGSYTKLDDLLEIGRNLLLATPVLRSQQGEQDASIGEKEELELRVGERQVVGMAVDSALASNDFETAYSYVVNHLRTPVDMSSQGVEVETRGFAESNIDDFSWRAAFQAGRHRTVTASQGPQSPQVRRLEQRMELLAQALLLAPPAALPEVLAAWRRCEEELLAVIGREHADERDFDDSAARGDVRMPGGYLGAEPTFTIQPKRKEMGRGATEESPMGLFDVARGAAAAIGRTAGALNNKARDSIAAGTIGDLRASASRMGEESAADASSAEARVRKRDMVANGLVSGLGWVLGAAPVQEQQR